MIARPLVLAALALAAPACDDPEPATVVFVTVDGRPGVAEVAAIDVTVRNESASVSQTFDLDGRSLPVTFTVTPTDRAGDVRIEVVALDAAQTLRGEGAATATIVDADRVDVDVLLDPADFPINEAVAGTQKLIFEYEASGRQLAAATDGFFVTFVNDCAQLGRCDVLARRFDAVGVPQVNQTTMDDGDFIANLTDEFTAAPSIAIGAQSVLIAWETNDAIKAVALARDGDHLDSSETIVSTTDLYVTDPSVTALASGDFLVAWSENQPDGTTAIRGRFLDATGNPRANPTTGDNLDFAVSWPEAGEAERVHVASTGAGHGFVAVWRHRPDFFEPANVRARFFTQTGVAAAVGNASVTDFGTGEVYGPHAVYLGANVALVGYAVESSDDPRFAGGAIAFTRFSSPAGNRVGADLIIPAQLDSFEVVAPALAQRDDGAIAATWHQCGADGDGQGCGILLQTLRSTGTPVGEPMIVNTTRRGDQQTPSIGALADRFAVAWTDGSMAPPDSDGLGIRGRLVYVDSEVHDGRLGARCGGGSDAPCAEGLSCVPGSGGEPLCHPVCSTSDTVPCPGGGVCSTIGEATACIY